MEGFGNSHWRLCLVVVVGLLAGTSPASGALSNVASLYEARQYSAASSALQRDISGARLGEEALWKSRLTTDPEIALGLLTDLFRDPACSGPVRVRVALEMTDILAGRGDYQAVVAVLRPLLAEDGFDLPGVLYLRSGIALRAQGHLQEAREMLASVRPSAPEFALARYYLGDIGLEQNDRPLAQRYFESANKAGGRAVLGRVGAGVWQTEMLRGNSAAADRLRTDLKAEDPGCLALLEINHWIQAEADERTARAASAPVDTVVTAIRETSGRYALQLGAFSDRRLALAFVRRYADRVSGLQVVADRDELGQILYKVRSGEYVNPALARNKAREVHDDLGVPVIVTEISHSERRRR